MKAIFIYNDHSANERAIIERAEREMETYITVIPLSQVQDPIRSFVRSTPCLITITDEMQGENLMEDGADGQLIVTAKLYKRLEEEEREVHQQETHRLDNMINAEKTTVIDTYTMDLVIEGGI